MSMSTVTIHLALTDEPVRALPGAREVEEQLRRYGVRSRVYRSSCEFTIKADFMQIQALTDWLFERGIGV